VQDRGLAAYITELVGTFFFVFFFASVAILYVATGAQAQFGSDFVVVGLVNGFVLLMLLLVMGGVSGGHFNPAVTAAAAALRRIDPVDAVVYVLAQLSGGVLGALLAKGLFLDEGRASDYGAPVISPLLSGNFAGFVVEAIGTFLVVLALLAIAFNPKVRTEWKQWAPLGVGLTLAFVVMVFGPLTGAPVNPARWFGPALIGEEFSSVWPYLGGELVGGLAAAGFFALVLLPGDRGDGPGDTAAERKPAGTAA